jgi:hypothetical protein
MNDTGCIALVDTTRDELRERPVGGVVVGLLAVKPGVGQRESCRPVITRVDRCGCVAGSPRAYREVERVG